MNPWVWLTVIVMIIVMTIVTGCWIHTPWVCVHPWAQVEFCGWLVTASGVFNWLSLTFTSLVSTPQFQQADLGALHHYYNTLSITLPKHLTQYTVKLINCLSPWRDCKSPKSTYHIVFDIISTTSRMVLGMLSKNVNWINEWLNACVSASRI